MAQTFECLVMQKGDVTGLVIVGILLAGIGMFFAFAKPAPEVAYVPVEITGTSVTLGEVMDTTVVVAGEIRQPGFITLHQAIGEAPGPIVAVSPLLAVGIYDRLELEATEELLSAGGYYVLVFVDNGDGVYEPGVDLPVMSNGEVIKIKVNNL